ncbi:MULTISPECIES: glycosyltransferase family 39 protein [Sphingomonas]|uniref:glycosyltransferase family 39 protein n=1 Tax=Sphingomonas TaxID=13687 RepID=UPI000DEF6C40|nr:MULTISPECIES: glycosyltransferase family 39 protein [Sphingomonas]
MTSAAIAPVSARLPRRASLQPPSFPPRQALVIGAILLVATLIARGQTFGNPVLGFDEQFYLVVGDRLLGGALPFVDVFDRKPIGLFLIYGFIRLLGGEGTIQYQLVAGLFAWGTATLVWRFAGRVGNARGAIAAALAYLLWLDLMEGEGGQAPVFFNLPVLWAAMLTEQAIRRGRIDWRAGLAPMLIVGVAIQIKYTALFEGIFFGCALLVGAWRARAGTASLIGMAAVWVLMALLPTLVAYLAYLALGHGQDFLFANFISMWGKLADPFATSAIGLVTIAGILFPLTLCIILPPPADGEAQRRSLKFVYWWLAAAVAGMLVMRSFSTPQYAMPVLVPAVIAAAPRLGQMRPSPRLVWPFLLVIFVASQIVLWSLQNLKGRAHEAALITRAATPARGCLFVYDGYPALYRLTHACVLSRFLFPGHLNMENENSARALGVAPTVEVRRILAQRPATIVMDDPPFERVNSTTYAIVRAEVARHYVETFRMHTGDRNRLVFTRKDAVTPTAARR